MFNDTILTFAQAAQNKAALLKSSIVRYFVLSALAGVYVGFGIVLIFSVGAPLKAANSPALKVVMAATFGIALTLVIFAGSELFTGNNMIMLFGNWIKKVSWMDTAKVWTVSFLGNLAGSLLLAAVMMGTGLILKSPLKDFILTVSADKMNAPFSQLFFRGILCNMLVCLAIWSATKAKEEIAKIFLIFWCLLGFIGSGFEHSVANMTLLGMSLLIPHDPSVISWVGFAKNIIPVTLGNMVGGTLIIAGAYWYVSQAQQQAEPGGEKDV